MATRKCRPGFLQTFWGRRSKDGGHKGKYAALSVPGGLLFFKREMTRMQSPRSAWRMKISRCFSINLTELGTSWTSWDEKCFQNMSLSVQSSHGAVDSNFEINSVYLQNCDLWGFYSSRGCVVLLPDKKYYVSNCRTSMDRFRGLYRWGVWKVGTANIMPVKCTSNT